MTRPYRQIGGWHPEDIKAAVRKAGATLAQLSREAGLCTEACSQALHRDWPRAEEAIARCIGIPARKLWPQRYARRRRADRSAA